MQQRAIAIFTEDFPPCTGGIAQWAFSIAVELCKAYEPVIVYTKRKWVARQLIHENQPYQLMKMWGHDWSKYRTLYSRYYSWRFLREYPEPIIFTTTWGLAQSIYKFKKKMYFKLVTVAHGLDVTKKVSQKVQKNMEKTLSNADCIIAVSHFTKKRILEKISIDPYKIRVIPNGLDLNLFYPIGDVSNLREELGLKPDMRIILTLARVIERKGHDVVIRALQKVLRKYPDTVYIIAGPWQGRVIEELKQLVEDLDLTGHVLFTGYIEDGKLLQYYNLADVYIMVSRELTDKGDTEGFGITFLEANACAKPVIGSFSGGIPDAVIDGETGFLVDPLDTSKIAGRIIELFDNPALSVQLGRNGRSRIEKELTWEKIAKQIIQWVA